MAPDYVDSHELGLKGRYTVLMYRRLVLAIDNQLIRSTARGEQGTSTKTTGISELHYLFRQICSQGKVTSNGSCRFQLEPFQRQKFDNQVTEPFQ